VHPDGRLQRLRIAVAHAGEVRAGWAVIADVAQRCGIDLEVARGTDAFEQLVAAVPMYAGLTLEEIGGHGVRWPARQQAAPLHLDASAPAPAAAAPSAPALATAANDGSLALGTYRPIWASPEVEISPALKYLVPAQQLEVSPEDARRLGIVNGEAVIVAQNGTRMNARAAVRSSVPAGSAFLAEGIAVDSANALTERLIQVHKA
jgi:predicted molibdopterin-dependent oxidoreductase YjgC